MYKFLKIQGCSEGLREEKRLWLEKKYKACNIILLTRSSLGTTKVGFGVRKPCFRFSADLGHAISLIKEAMLPYLKSGRKEGLLRKWLHIICVLAVASMACSVTVSYKSLLPKKRKHGFRTPKIGNWRSQGANSQLIAKFRQTKVIFFQPINSIFYPIHSGLLHPIDRFFKITDVFVPFSIEPSQIELCRWISLFC